MSSKTFSKMRDYEVLILAEKVFDKSDTIGDGLVQFGITAEKRTAARAVLNDYIQKFGVLSSGKITKQSANATIKMLLKKADVKFKVLARLILNFKKSNPVLYNKCEIANTIIDKGGHGCDDTAQPPENPPTPPTQ